MKYINYFIVVFAFTFGSCEKDASLGDFLSEDDFDVLTDDSSEEESTEDTSAIYTIDLSSEVTNAIKITDSILAIKNQSKK